MTKKLKIALTIFTTVVALFFIANGVVDALKPEHEWTTVELMHISGVTRVTRWYSAGNTETITVNGDPFFRQSFPSSSTCQLDNPPDFDHCHWRYHIIYNATDPDHRIDVYVADTWFSIDDVYYRMGYMMDFCRSIDGIWNFYAKEGEWGT